MKAPQKESKEDQNQKEKLGRTNLPGQNPQANDDPSHDEHNDESRTP
jgi:hypothetical protein